VLSQGSQGQGAVRGQQVSNACIDGSLSDTRCPNQQNSLGKAREEVFKSKKRKYLPLKQHCQPSSQAPTQRRYSHIASYARNKSVVMSHAE